MHLVAETLFLATLAAGSPTGTSRLERVESVTAARRALLPSSRPRLLHFWALWCEPCVEELPRQVELARKAKAAGVDVVLVNLDPLEEEPEVIAHLDKLRALDAARHVQLSPGVDPLELARLFDPTWAASIPATFGLGADGKLALAFHEAMSRDDATRLLRALSPRGSRSKLVSTPTKEKSP